MRKLGALAVVVACGTAAAAPAQLATGGACPRGEPTRKEILPASAVAGSVKILPSPSGGLDVFWTAQPAVGDPHFMGMYAPYTAGGQRLGKPVKVVDQPIRNVASDGTGTFAFVWTVFESNGWQGHVTAVRPAQKKVLWDVAIPSRERGHGTIAIAWDGHAWVIVGEELIQLPDQPAGYVYNRLFTARLGTDGAWLREPSYLSDPLVTTQLSDWSNPLVAGNGRLAFAWAALDGKQAVLRVTELGDRGPVTVDVAKAPPGFMRTVIAWAGDRYVVAGGLTGPAPLDSRLFVTTVKDGVATPLQFLSTKGLHASEAVVAAAGTRAAVAWDEDEIDKGQRRTIVRAAVIDARGTVTPVYVSNTPADEHDWVQSLAWDGCRFALVHTWGINPSAIELVRF